MTRVCREPVRGKAASWVTARVALVECARLLRDLEQIGIRNMAQRSMHDRHADERARHGYFHAVSSQGRPHLELDGRTRQSHAKAHVAALSISLCCLAHAEHVVGFL
jgi:hypothetical protein